MFFSRYILTLFSHIYGLVPWLIYRGNAGLFDGNKERKFTEDISVLLCMFSLGIWYWPVISWRTAKLMITKCWCIIVMITIQKFRCQLQSYILWYILPFFSSRFHVSSKSWCLVVGFCLTIRFPVLRIICTDWRSVKDSVN